MAEILKQLDKQNRIMIPKEVLTESGITQDHYLSVKYDEANHQIIIKPMRLVEDKK